MQEDFRGTMPRLPILDWSMRCVLTLIGSLRTFGALTLAVGLAPQEEGVVFSGAEYILKLDEFFLDSWHNT